MRNCILGILKPHRKLLCLSHLWGLLLFLLLVFSDLALFYSTPCTSYLILDIWIHFCGMLRHGLICSQRG